MDDPRIEKAKELGEAIMKAADALDTAIYQAKQFGYHAVIRIDGIDLGKGRWIGSDDKRVTIKGSLNFDIGKAI